MASGKVKNEKKSQGGKESVQAPRFFPNLSSLKIEKSNAVESGMMVVVRLPPLSAEERLDADTNAAVMLMVRLDKSAMFEVPRKMFPGNAPLPKLNYLPQHLLPANMEAGGVFAAGALAHKCYPTGLLPSGFRGATPALFVGRRALAKQLQLKNAASLHPRQLRASCSAPRTAGEELPRPPDALARLLPTTPTLRDGHIDYAMGPNISMGVVIAHQTWLEKAREFAGQPLQYRIYTPDLSGVAIMVQQRLRMCVVRLSDVLHPHETSVASHLARDHTTPTFELPKELLLCSGRQLKRDPLYLSRPHLPRGFVAGCVFAPGTMPSRLFNCLPLNVPPLWQRREDVTPPVFLGVWDPDLDPLAQLVPLGSYVKYLEMLPLDPALLAAVQDSTNEQVIVIGGPELPLFEELFPGELPTATNEQEEEKTVVDCVSESDNDIELRKVSKPLTYRESCQLYFGKDTDESSEEEDDGQPASIVTPKKVEAQLKLELEKNQARSEAEAKMVAKKKADETENKLLQESVHIEKTAQTKEPPARINKTAQAKEAAHMTKTKTKSYQFKEPAPINESTQMKTAQAKEAAHMTKTKSYQFKEPAPIEESTQMKTAQAKEAAHMTKTKSYQFKEPAPIEESTQMKTAQAKEAAHMTKTKSYQFKEPAPIEESTQMKTAQAKEAAHMTKTKSYQFKEPAPIEESTQMKTAQAKEAAHMTKTKTKSYQFKEPTPINESTQMKTAQAKEAAHMTKTKSYQFKEPAPIEESTQMKTAQAKEAAHMTKTKTKSYQFKEPTPINESTQMKTAQAKEAAHMTKTKSYQFKEPAPIEESTQMKTAQAKEAAHMTKTKTKSYQFKEPTPINESTQMKTAQAKEAAHMTKTKSYQFKEPAPIEESTQMKTAQAKEAAHMTKTKTKSYQFKEPAPINESTQMTPPPKTSKDSPKKQEMFQAQKDQSMFWPPDPELHTQKVKQRQPLSDIVQNDPQISPEELKHRKRQARIVSVIRWIKQSHEAEFIRTNAQNSAMPSNDDDEEGAMNVNDLLPQFNQILRILEDHLPDEGKPWDMMTQLERAVSNTSDFVLIHIDKVLYNMIKLLTKNQAAASNNGKEQRNQGLQFLQEPISDSNDARSNEPSPPTTTTGEEEPCWLFKLTGNRQKIYRLMRYVQNRGIKVEPVFQPNNADSNAHYRQMRRLCDKIEVQPPPSPQ